MMEVSIVRSMRNIWKYQGVARVDGEIAAEAELMCVEEP